MVRFVTIMLILSPNTLPREFMAKKQETVAIFRERLLALVNRSNLSRSKFAAQAGLDRSTLSQLLSDANVRLPRAETIARLASQYNVSVDWLLGLSQEDQLATDILPLVQIETGVKSSADERILSWSKEAAGYKIRYVPMSLPDILKTNDVFEYEFDVNTSTTAAARLEEAELKLGLARNSSYDMEACSSFQSVEMFARGEGTWGELSSDIRRQQLIHMQSLLGELYPSFRWYLFDGMSVFSAAYTIFGPHRGAVYLGGMYFVFNSTEHIRVLTRHFDNLIREAVIQPNEASDFIGKLIREVS